MAVVSLPRTQLAGDEAGGTRHGEVTSVLAQGAGPRSPEHSWPLTVTYGRAISGQEPRAPASWEGCFSEDTGKAQPRDPAPLGLHAQCPFPSMWPSSVPAGPRVGDLTAPGSRLAGEDGPSFGAARSAQDRISDEDTLG